jgi:hypothetical protein
MDSILHVKDGLAGSFFEIQHVAYKKLTSSAKTESARVENYIHANGNL